MVDAEEQDRIEEQRLLDPPIDPIELDENATVAEKMKANLSELLHKDPNDKGDDNDLLILLDILEEDDDPDDDAFKGKYGNYSIGDGFVGGDVFKEGTANDSIENINGVLEMASVAKAALGDKELMMVGGDDPEQLAMHAYAGELAGLNVANSDHGDLDPEIKQKMDQAWSAMNGDNTPTLSNELNQDATLQAEVQQPNALSM